MKLYEIIGGAVLILICILIVILCLAQGSKDQGMTTAITGGQNESFYGKNSSRTKEAKLAKLTKILAIIFFVGTLALNVVPAFFD